MQLVNGCQGFKFILNIGDLQCYVKVGESLCLEHCTEQSKKLLAGGYKKNILRFLAEKKHY
jgi:hypothetical protein